MFKRIQSMQSLTIPNDVFNNFVGNLYDSSPYRFDVIPLKTLSDIYDLFLGYQLIIKEGAVTDELKSEFKKKQWGSNHTRKTCETSHRIDFV